MNSSLCFSNSIQTRHMRFTRRYLIAKCGYAMCVHEQKISEYFKIFYSYFCPFYVITHPWKYKFQTVISLQRAIKMCDIAFQSLDIFSFIILSFISHIGIYIILQIYRTFLRTSRIYRHYRWRTSVVILFRGQSIILISRLFLNLNIIFQYAINVISFLTRSICINSTWT